MTCVWTYPPAPHRFIAEGYAQGLEDGRIEGLTSGYATGFEYGRTLGEEIGALVGAAAAIAHIDSGLEVDGIWDAPDSLDGSLQALQGLPTHSPESPHTNHYSDAKVRRLKTAVDIVNMGRDLIESLAAAFSEAQARAQRLSYRSSLEAADSQIQQSEEDDILMPDTDPDDPRSPSASIRPPSSQAYYDQYPPSSPSEPESSTIMEEHVIDLEKIKAKWKLLRALCRNDPALDQMLKRSEMDQEPPPVKDGVEVTVRNVAQAFRGMSF